MFYFYFSKYLYKHKYVQFLSLINLRRRLMRLPIAMVTIAIVTAVVAVTTVAMVASADAINGEEGSKDTTADAPIVNSKTDSKSYDLILQLSKRATYSLVGAPYSDENRQQFEQMSEEDQKKFLARRELYLKKVSAVLHYTKLIYGSGSLTFNKIKVVAKPLIVLIKSSTITAYNKTKGFLFIAKSKVPSSLRIKRHKDTIGKESDADVDASARPAMAVSVRAINFAKNLILQSNQKLKNFNERLLNKIYDDLPAHLRPGFVAELPTELPIALPIQEIAAASLQGATPNAIECSTQSSIQQDDVVVSALSKTTLLSRIRERSEKMVLKLLQKLDRTLWEQSKFVASQNEVVIVGSLNIIGLSGVGSQVSGGLPQGLGFKFGINWESQALVFEIYHEAESLTYAVTPSSSYGFTPKLGFAIISQDLNNVVGSRTGYYAYPAGAPGVSLSPGYTAIFRDSVATGFTTNLLTAPLSIAGDFFWYNTYAAQRPLLRVTGSFKDVGFLRAKFISFKTPEQAAKDNAQVDPNDQFVLPVQLIEESLAAEEAVASGNDADTVAEAATHPPQPTTCANILSRSTSE